VLGKYERPLEPIDDNLLFEEGVPRPIRVAVGTGFTHTGQSVDLITANKIGRMTVSICRHEAIPANGLNILPTAWIPWSEFFERVRLTHRRTVYTEDMLIYGALSATGGRILIRFDGDRPTYIKAFAGHGEHVMPYLRINQYLTEITSSSAPPTCSHGTNESAAYSIMAWFPVMLKCGGNNSRGSKQQLYCSLYRAMDKRARDSGMRSNPQYEFVLNVPMMLKDGYEVYMSKQKAVLITENVLLRYFDMVYHVPSETIVYKRPDPFILNKKIRCPGCKKEWPLG